MDNLEGLFGPLLYEKRKSKGLTQEMLAQKSGFDRKYIYLLEKSKHQPSLPAIFALSAALEITPMELIEEIYMKRQQKK